MKLDADMLLERCLKALHLKLGSIESKDIYGSVVKYLLPLKESSKQLCFTVLDHYADNIDEDAISPHLKSFSDIVLLSSSNRIQMWGWLSKRDLLLDILDSDSIDFREYDENRNQYVVNH